MTSYMRKRILPLALLSAVVLAGSCRNPFTIGLGDDVDIQSPDLVVTSHVNGEYVKGILVLEGTYADDLQDVAVRVSLNGGASYAPASVDPATSHWSYTLDTVGQLDGGRDLVVRATDGSGKNIDKRILLYFDNTPPIVLVKVPLGYAYPPNEYNGIVSIRGDATDQFPIQQVSVKVYNASGTLLASSTGDIGTNTWTYPFPSVGLVAGIENCDVIVTATDRAGNQNSTFYHIADVTAYNSGVALSVEEVAALDATSAPFRAIAVTADPALLPTARKLTLHINQGLDLPVFDIYNPDPGGTPAENVLSPSAKAIGMVTDDAEGVNVSTIEIQFTTGGVPGGWNPVQTTVGTGLAVRWEHSLASLTPGDYTLQLRARDNLGAQGYSVEADFSIDAGAPIVEISSPTQGAYLNSTSFMISGTAASGDTVTDVSVSLDDGATYSPASSTSGDYDTWQFSVVGAPTDAVSIKAKATAGAKVAYYNLAVVVDIQPPIVSFLSPTKANSVNGPVTVRGTSSDNRQITKVELRLGEPANWIVLSDPYSWDYLFDSAGYANATYATESPPGSNIWKLNVYARVTDIAGNIKTTPPSPDPGSYYFFIDQALDKPRVTVISPPAGTTNVAGPVLISGTALDDDGLYRVEMQIDVNGNGNFTDYVDFWSGTVKGPDGDTLDRFESENTWYPVSGTSLWSQQINGYGEMYQIEAGHGDITVRVRAVDTKDGGLTAGIEGDFSQFSIHLDDTIPRIESLNLVSGDYVKGVFHITGQALDDEQIGTVQISYDGGINYQNLPGGSYTVNSVKDWSLDITLDTRPSGLNISSGILYLRLKITDNANYQSLTPLNLNVDNVYPTNNPSGYTGAASDINSAAARVQGTARDAGTVSGVEEIEVYFVRDIAGVLYVYNPKTAGAPTPVGSYDFGDGSGAVSYPTGAGSENYKITINDFNEFGNDAGGNGDGDGFNESLTLAGSTYNWWAEFNSNVIPDGTLQIHYVIFDNAGNGSHYQTAGFVKNHKPSITSVTVGSDIDQSGTVEGDEQFTYTGAFKARYRLYVAIDATDNQPIAGYEVIYDPPSGPPQVVLSAASGTLNITSGYEEGAGTLLCRVTDADGITAETLLLVTIENNDTVAPVITLAPLAQGQLVLGHLEGVSESLHDNSPLADADLSGTIALTGSASDNQRIQRISVQITGFDPDGGGPLAAGDEKTVASWTGMELVSSDAAFVISNPSLSESTGHQVSWTYTWNSAGVTNVAADNLQVRFRAYDFAPAASLDSETVDVVPYVSDITRTLSTNRSKYGRFAVQEGETGVVLSGYNLAQTGTNWVRVYNTAGTASDTVTVTAADAVSYRSLTVSLAGVTHSGWLRLAVNGVEAINNTNNNALSHNKEDDGSGLGSTLWNDDRYLRVWAVGGSFNQSANPEHPSMSITSTGTLYGAWTNNAGSSGYYATTAARTTFHNKYDPPVYTDLVIDAANNLNIGFLANYFDGNTAWGFVAVWAVGAPNQSNWNNYDGYAFEWLGSDDMLFQFQRPRVVRSGNNIHLAYYDVNTKTIKYGYVVSTDLSSQNISDTAPNGANLEPHLNLDGGEAYPAGNGQTGTLTSLAGEYLAMDLDEAGCPVIMYYDNASQTLKLAWSTSATPTAYTNWRIQSVFQAGDPNRTYSGKYITMKIDTGGNVHAAFSRTSSGSLIYLYAPDADGANYVFQNSVEVDYEGAVGTWPDITLNGTTPYVSYLNNSMIGTFEGLKMAYYDSGLGGWEYEILPLNTGVTDNRTNIEYRKGTVAWTVALGYGSDNFDLVYLRPEE
jgi:hypothetical protein